VKKVKFKKIICTLFVSIVCLTCCSSNNKSLEVEEMNFSSDSLITFNSKDNYFELKLPINENYHYSEFEIKANGDITENDIDCITENSDIADIKFRYIYNNIFHYYVAPKSVGETYVYVKCGGKQTSKLKVIVTEPEIITTTEVTIVESTTEFFSNTTESFSNTVNFDYRKKEKAQEIDDQVWSIVLISEKGVEILRDGCELYSLSPSQETLSELQNLVEECGKTQEKCISTLNSVNVFGDNSYYDIAETYLYNAKDIVDNVVKFTKNFDSTYVDKALSAIDRADEISVLLVSERVKFLADAGFTIEEIGNIEPKYFKN